MSGNQNEKLTEDVTQFSQDLAYETAKNSAEYFSDLAQSEAQAYDQLAGKAYADLQAAQRLAQKYAERAIAEGDASRADYFNNLSNQFNEVAHSKEGLTSERWINGVLLDKASGVLKSMGPIGDGLDLAEAAWAIKEGNYDELGRVSSGILGGIVAGAIAAAFIATLPVSGGIALGAAIVAGLFGGWAGEWWWDNIVSSSVNTDFSAAQNFVQRRDPLALDLDGDGIETVGTNNGITFDFNGDGLKTGTGWVKGDDGFLALDINGNGIIDTGAELFGVDTIKANGEKAIDGFDALRDLDSNSDEVFDAQDAQFANVRVWQDLNQDGNSQANELKSLAELNIVAINLDATATRQNSNGNLISATGTFIRGDGSEGGVNDNQSLAANLDLASNPFYREFTDSVPLDEQSKTLPGMRGSGAVRDLREAAAGSSELRDSLSAYSAATTRQEQLSKLDGLVRAWAATADFRTWDERIGELGNEGLEVRFAYSWEKPVGDGIGTGASGGTAGGSAVLGGGDSGPTTEQLATRSLLEKIRVLEVFNAQNFFNFSSTSKTEANGQKSASFEVASGTISRSVRMLLTEVRTVYLTEKDFAFNAEQIRLLNNAYESLMQSVYDGLLLQTRLKPYSDAVSLTVSESGLALDYSGALDKLTQVHASDPIKAIVDLLELGSVLAGRAGWSGNEVALAGDWVRQLTPNRYAELQVQLGASSSVAFASLDSLNLTGGGQTDFLFGSAGNNSLKGNAGSDFMDGDAGSDTLYGGAGKDWLKGGEGADRLYGEDGRDQLLGAEGNDTLSGGNGDDVLDGGIGNDNLSGDVGSDVYRFSRGWGQDSVNNYDTSTGKVDAIEFAADIAPGDIIITRSGSDLVLSLVGSTDKVTVNNYFTSDGASTYKLEEIRFADGTSWSVDKVKELALRSTGGDDKLTGYASDDQLNGGAGNDYLSGAAGNDVLGGDAGNDNLSGDDGNDSLNGGEGNDNLSGGNGNDALNGGAGTDSLNGGSGNDVLDGGVGNDSLSGDAGNDVYRFSRGWGQDSVNNYDTSTGKVDAIEFAADIAPSDIIITRSGSDLVLSLVGSTDKVTVNNYFTSDGASTYKLEEIRFADGTSWSVDKVKELALRSTGGDDKLTGYASDDQLNGGAGNDYLSGAAGNDVLGGDAGNDNLSGDDGNDSLNGGEGNDNLSGGNGNDALNGGAGTDSLNGGSGNDVLDGGVGNDSLSGDAGSDVYRFTRGWGQDSVNNYDTSTGKVDAIEFAADIAPSDIIITRSGSNLVLSLVGSTDKVTVNNYFTSDGASTYKLEEIRFADGTSWSVDQVKELALRSTGGDDNLTGYASDDQFNGGAGNDYLSGAAGNDVLGGDAGNDNLNGGNGNDVLDGGAGNDSLSGDAGSDVYRFSRGWGQDTVSNNDSSTGKVDAIEFAADIAPSDIQVTRSGDNLILSLVGSTDKVTVSNYFNSNGASNYKLEEIRFAGGTVWALADIKQMTVYGTAHNDSLADWDNLGELHGGAGNDTLDGGNGTNRLFGEAGDDVLRTDTGSSDNNVLAGGTGNDTLNGSYKSDTYLFNLGDGVDSIVETGTQTGAVDVLRFGEGIKLEDLQFQRSGVDLVIAHANGVDKVVLKNALTSTTVMATWGSTTLIEKVEFADGTTLTWAQLFANGWVQQGGSGNETLIGHAGTDELRGGAGNDTLDGGDGSNRLFGEAGDDVLRTDTGSSDNNVLAGGTGNDTLNGSYKSDTYLFNLGDGVDSIVETGSHTGAVDVLQFGSDIDAEELWLSRSGNDLKLQVIGTDDSVSIKNWYSSSSYQVEQLQVADGRALTASQVQNLVNAMASFGVPSGGESNLTADQRQQLDVVIAANWQ
ncbi:calcium-binding protein [Pseudomonas sp. PDM15]|uniref:calcium-binding protein n=1 Tax=Pseudomonas sp. PDM15 TaxID=2769303 RepID=UPI00177B7AEA|nr:calcium-binding protein [Pseudomonas sp. PDM15]MBD9425934.1 calcium-binding protein [Pseudomonas sp. PDM15]